MAEVNLEPKVWWQKQRTWAMLLGVASAVCSVIPGAAVASAPLLAVATLLGFKGFSDASDRTENLLKTEVKLLQK